MRAPRVCSIVQTFAGTPAVTSPVLKCIAELAFNRASRIIFGPSSANGILLFREASNAIVTYGSRMLGFAPVRVQRLNVMRELPRAYAPCECALLQVAQNAYAEKYKGVAICLDILTKSLEGGYVNFGVFALYNDPALDRAMDVVLQLMLNVAVDVIMVRARCWWERGPLPSARTRACCMEGKGARAVIC